MKRYFRTIYHVMLLTLVGLSNIIGAVREKPGIVAFAAEPPTFLTTFFQSARCAPLNETIGDIIYVSDVKELKSAVKTINSSGGNKTILLEDGTYELNKVLNVKVPNVMFRSASGNRDKVILKGKGMKGSVTHIFRVVADNITIADMTIGEVKNHPIQVHGELDADNLFVHNVRIYNGREQLLKGSHDNNNFNVGPDNGIVECCLFEFPAGHSYQSYTGGMDVHNAKNWIVRDNVFRNIRSPGGGIVSDPTVNFWNSSENTIVERNIFINCDRSISFGLTNKENKGHTGGIIRNNVIYNDGKGRYDDVGILLENADGAKVYNNTIYHEQRYPNAIEYRFAGTNAEIFNNLTNKAIIQRSGGNANLGNNVTNAQRGWFIEPFIGDLHLAFPVDAVVDQGTALADVTEDFDQEGRPQGESFDIGADEYTGTSVIWSLLTVNKEGTGQGVITSMPSSINCGEKCDANFEANTAITLTAQAYQGSKFTGWSGGGCSGTQSCTLRLTTHTTITATFEFQREEAQASNIQVRHVDGQTFVTWREAVDIVTEDDITYGEFFLKKSSFPYDVKYRIYRSENPITSVAGMDPIGEAEALSAWNQEFYGISTNRKKYANYQALRYVIEDGQEPLPLGTGIYVHNPDSQGSGYYAVTVVIDGEENTTMNNHNSTQTFLIETVGQGKPILQRVEKPDSFTYISNPTLYYYTRWEGPPNIAPDMEGTPYAYLVAIPPKVADPAPVGIHLHSWGGNLERGYGWWTDAEDGAILLASNQYPPDWWTGYHEKYWDGGLKKQKVLKDGVVRPYTTTRLLSFLDWMTNTSQWNIDLTRTFTAGSSMGGSGSLMFAIRYPERVAWARSWVGVHIPAKSPKFKNSYGRVYGAEEEGVLFEDGTPVWDYYNDAWYLRQYPEKEIGFITFSNGKNDRGIGWEQAVEFYHALQETKRPHLFIWGQRGHKERTVMPGNGSQRVMPIDIRIDQTLPAFTRCSLDDNLGNGDPNDGDPTGQVNRYLYWETDDIVDTPEAWEMTVALMDSAPVDTATVDITPRRVQHFHPRPGETVIWTNTNVTTGQVIETGEATVDQVALLTLEQVTIGKGKNRITITLPSTQTLKQ